MAFRESDILKSKSGDETRPVFTEEDRSKIRQTLTTFSQKICLSKKKKTVSKKSIPSIVEQSYHVTFSWRDFPAELDEVPHLFLIRLNLWPLLRFATLISLEELQEVCIQSGVSGIATDVKGLGYYMTGTLANGGPVKSIRLTLQPSKSRDIVSLVNCTFVSHTE